MTKKREQPTELYIEPVYEEAARELLTVIDSEDSNLATAESVSVVVPEQFARMPDDVLAVALQAYAEFISLGQSHDAAVANAITSAKAWAAEHQTDIRK